MIEPAGTDTGGPDTAKGDGRALVLIREGQATDSPPQAVDIAIQLEETLGAVRSLLARLDMEIAKARRSLQELESFRARILSQLKEVAESRPNPWAS
ncbi:hypothetical protein HRbin24_00667 [bacterium HR24]|jgi:hypothetical protein|nr:hypothetical protein HRbin24_00667 [bacterium HR24]